MTVTLSIESYELPFPHQVDTAQVSLKMRHGWRLWLSQNERFLGIGEIAPWRGFAHGPERIAAEIEKYHQSSTLQSEVQKALNTALDDEQELRLLKQDLDLCEGLRERAERLSEYLLPILSLFEGPELRCGIEIAVLDAMSRSFSMPLSALLNPATTLIARTHCLVKSREEAIESARKGYQAIKIKVGVASHWVEELMEIARIHATLPQMEIRVDANRAWNSELAYGFVIAARAFGVSWVEEPCHDLGTYLDLISRLNKERLSYTPLGLDESLSELEQGLKDRSESSQFQKKLAELPASVMTLKPMALGGLLNTIFVALSEELSGKRCCITHMMGSWVERTATAHLVAALKPAIPSLAAGLGGGLTDDLSTPLPVFGGALRLSTEPGLGGELRGGFSKLLSNRSTEVLKETSFGSSAHHPSPLYRTLRASQDQLPHPLEMAAIARPDHPGLVIEGEEWSFKALRDAARAMAVSLSPHFNDQIGDDETEPVIALSGVLSLEWVIACHALTGLGVTVAPLKPALTDTEFKQAIELARAEWHLTFEERSSENPHMLKMRFQKISTDQVFSFEIALLSKERDNAIHSVQELEKQRKERRSLRGWKWERPLFVINTSGTTGRPQAIPLCTRQLCLSAFGSAIRLGHELSDRWLACLPPYHVGGLSTVIRCLFNQITLQVVEPKALHIADSLSSVSVGSLTPTLLSELVTHLKEHAHVAKPIAFRSLRALLIGGGPTPRGLWEEATALGLPLRLTWGMSEAASQLCTQVKPAPPMTPIPPLPFVELSQVEVGEEREGGSPSRRLVVSGPLLASGHLETGDEGEIREEGVVVLGRVDDAIISGGLNISPLEIEEILSTHPLIAEVGVRGRADKRYGERPIAFITLKSQGEDHDRLQISRESLRSWLRSRLSPYKIPDEFYLVERLPKSELGKLQRRLLNESASVSLQSKSDLSPLVEGEIT